MLTEQEARNQVVEICRLMYNKNFVVASDGNVSLKLSRNRLLTTPSGLSKGFLTPEQLVITDFAGKKLSGKLKPSSEIRMHLCAYQERPDINAVIHAHPPMSTAFSIAGVSLARCILPEVVLTLGSVPTTRYATPTTAEGPDVIREYIRDYDALILDRHGSLTVGHDLMSAFMKLEKVEHAALVTHHARQLGNVNLLTQQQIHKLLQTREELGIKGKKPNCVECGACLGKETSASQPDKTTDQDTINIIVDEILKEKTSIS
jgi:L-fuculose-phosphate aldolase